MKVISALVFGLILLSACAQQPSVTTSSADGRINHVILIWLKDSGNLQQRQQIIEATRDLELIPGVIRIRVGEVVTSQRDIVDDSFDIGVHMLFSDRDTMNQYLSHPEHLRTVNQIVQPLSEKIVIYDFEG